MRRTTAVFIAIAGIFVATTTLGDSKVPAGATDQRASAVRTIRLDAHGRRTGLILRDGTELVSTNVDRIAEVVQPGDEVWVAVGPGDTLQLIDWPNRKAVSIGPRDLVDLGPFVPPSIGGGPRPEGANDQLIDDASKLPRLVEDGRVVLLMHSPVGAPSGFILDDGTQVHLIPRVADILTKNVHVGDRLHVEGPGRTSNDGRGMWATTISRPDRYVILDLMRSPTGVPELGIAAAKR